MPVTRRRAEPSPTYPVPIRFTPGHGLGRLDYFGTPLILTETCVKPVSRMPLEVKPGLWIDVQLANEG
jgi:hypothetical protein